MRTMKRGHECRVERDGKDVTLYLLRGAPVRALPLQAGTDDTVSVFDHEGEIVVFSCSIGAPYVGVEVFSRMSGTLLWEVFLQGDQVEEFLGRDWDDRTTMTLTKRLLAAREVA